MNKGIYANKRYTDSPIISKKMLLVLSSALILLAAVLFLFSGCRDKASWDKTYAGTDIPDPEKSAYKTATPEEEAGVEIERIEKRPNTVGEDIDSALEELTDNPASHLFVIGKDEPKKRFSIGFVDVRRTSRDKGMIKNIEFTVRNFDEKEFFPVVEFTMPGYDRGKFMTLIKRFELPLLKPGMRFTHKYPVEMYFHEVDREKALNTTAYRKFTDPREFIAKVDYKFVPSKVWKSDEITWT